MSVVDFRGFFNMHKKAKERGKELAEFLKKHCAPEALAQEDPATLEDRMTKIFYDNEKQSASYYKKDNGRD